MDVFKFNKSYEIMKAAIRLNINKLQVVNWEHDGVQNNAALKARHSWTLRTLKKKLCFD